MLIRNRINNRRRGATMVECAIVLPVVFLFLIGHVVIGLGVFRYQQVATLAREGARYASVHGGLYQRETGKAAATPLEVYTNAILPMAAGLQTSKIKYSVDWDEPKAKNPTYQSDPDTNKYLINKVTVVVSYEWLPEAYFGNSIRVLSSTSKKPMTY